MFSSLFIDFMPLLKSLFKLGIIVFLFGVMLVIIPSVRSQHDDDYDD